MTEITRKQFIKLLAAAGGAATLAGFLPGKWVKPIVKVGVLPVHAQSSGLTIQNLSIELRGAPRVSPRGNGLASPIQLRRNNAQGTCNYTDDMGEIDDTAQIYLTATNGPLSDVLINWQVLSTIGSITPTDSHSGTILFTFYLPEDYFDMNARFYLTVKMDGRTAGPIEGNLLPT